jgi:hypothetical protein
MTCIAKVPVIIDSFIGDQPGSNEEQEAQLSSS